MEEALKPLEEVAASVPPEIRELAALRNKEFREFVRERIERQIRTLLPLIEELKQMVEPSALERDFSREDLERTLG